MQNHAYNNSEHQSLISVMLYKPTCESKVEQIDETLFINTVNRKKLIDEITILEKCYQENNIQTNYIAPPNPTKHSKDAWLNMIFVRDLFFMTPFGAIISNMGVSLRKNEPAEAMKLFQQLKIPIFEIFDSDATFEGADALWLKPDLVLVGVGKRTNQKGFKQLTGFLSQYEIKTIASSVRTTHPQHLLGALQIVDHNLALARKSIIDPAVIDLLRKLDYKIVLLEETQELAKHQAFNFVTIAPKKIIIPANCPNTVKLLKAHEISIAAEIDIPNLIHAAGGIACATGIISRDFI